MDTYKSTNTKNGKFYIGSTTDYESRKRSHLRSKENYPFQNALRQDPDAFVWEVWTDDSDEPILEQALLDMFYGTEQCYNLSPIANRPPSVEGKKMWVHTSGKQTFAFESPGPGWKVGVSEERRLQNGRAKRGKKESAETRKKKSDSHKGKTRIFSEEHCKNISRGKTGKSAGHEGGRAAGKLPWWYNPQTHERKRSYESPGEGWENRKGPNNKKCG